MNCNEQDLIEKSFKNVPRKGDFFAGLCACGPMSWAQEVIIFVHSTDFTGVASSAFDLKLSAPVRCASDN